jgi:hypothetical protein
MSLDGAELTLVRSAFQRVASVREVKMFGGTAFMVNGHMTVAVSPRGLLVRVGPDEHDEALKQPGTRAMEMRGRVMTGYIYVDPVPSDARIVQSWVQSVLFAWIYDRMFASSSSSIVAVVIKYAFLGAALSWSFTTLAVGAKNNMSSVPRFMLIETAFTIVQWLMVAPLSVLAFHAARRSTSSIADVTTSR